MSDVPLPPLTPDHRARGAVHGTPVEIEGQTWVFAGCVPRPEPVWDAVYDHNVLAGRYDLPVVYMAAIRLLDRNYEVSPEEAADLVVKAEVPSLVGAVEAAIFGPTPAYRGYSDWVASACWANGVDPDAVPPERMRHVLDQLVATGRAVPAAQFISSVEAAQLRADLSQLARPAP